MFEYLAKHGKLADRDEVLKALKIDIDATSSILLAYYRQALISRELPFEVPIHIKLGLCYREHAVTCFRVYRQRLVNREPRLFYINS